MYGHLVPPLSLLYPPSSYLHSHSSLPPPYSHIAAIRAQQLSEFWNYQDLAYPSLIDDVNSLKGFRFSQVNDSFFTQYSNILTLIFDRTLSLNDNYWVAIQFYLNKLDNPSDRFAGNYYYFVSNPLVVDGTHETHKLTSNMEVEETKTRVVYQQPPKETATTLVTTTPEDKMVPMSTIQAIIQSMKDPRERDRDTGHEAYTLDGIKWPCTIKGQGPTRMLKVNGPLRAMGAIRANVVFRDLFGKG